MNEMTAATEMYKRKVRGVEPVVTFEAGVFLAEVYTAGNWKFEDRQRESERVDV